jgi:Xaa-Pro aminopeptidase
MDATAGRLHRLREAMATNGLDALLVSQPAARRYLSGYTATDLPPRESAGYLFITDSRQFLLTDPRTEALAAAEAPTYELRVYSGQKRTSDVLKELAAEALPNGTALPKVGFEASHVPYALWQAFATAFEGLAEVVPAPDLVDDLRVVKDDAELDALKASIALNDAALAHLVRVVKEGRTELEMAWEMENFVRSHGAEAVSFEPITVAGPNTAIPHAMPSDRTIRSDELVLFDIGARLGGYCSDMTRTFCIESVSPKLREIWQIVLDAVLMAEAQARPGMTGTDLDNVARKVITDAGYGEAFIHGTGHGVGLEIHEPPWISARAGGDELRPGMVFSIEPGIYLPDVGGVRIEDLVLLTEHGAEVLTHSPKKLQLSEVLLDLDR